MIENSPAFQRRESIVSCISPEGTADWKHLWHEFSRPFGTGLCVLLNPALKRWAILRMSLRDKAVGAAREFPKGIRAKAPPVFADVICERLPCSRSHHATVLETRFEPDVLHAGSARLRARHRGPARDLPHAQSRIRYVHQRQGAEQS